MREEEFRRRLQGAIGEPPPLASPVLRAPAAAARRVYPRAMGLLAIAVAIVLIAVLVGSRLALQPRGFLSPASTPGVGQLAPDSMPCHLAVNLVQEADNPGGASATSSTLGFINIPDGTFQVDPTGTVTDLPGPGAGLQQGIYSTALQRWLPARISSVSPDGRSYAYVTQLASGSELHVVDAARKADRKVWSSPDEMQLVVWSASGIVVQTVPQGGGIARYWYVDPAGGRSTPAPNYVDPQSAAIRTLPSGSYSSNGADAAGNTVLRYGARGGSDPEKVYVVQSGQPTLIFSGHAGDASDFDPAGFFVDAHGVWIGNIDGTRVWLWSQASGLRSFKVSGAPPLPAGYAFTSIAFQPSGPCVPGLLQGTAATPMPAAGPPTPSPSPPTVDWSPYLAKPVTLQDLQPGQSCSATPQVSLNGQTNSGPKKGSIPNYGYGRSPVYLSGQVQWYSGSQAFLVLSDPSYTGPVLVRVKRLDGGGAATLQGGTSYGQQLAPGALGIPQTSSPPYWGFWDGMISFSAPGCYGMQFDGNGFAESVTIQVQKGPPPPG